MLISTSHHLHQVFQNFAPTARPTTMRRALLIRPNAFGFAHESATDNTYMDAAVHIDRQRACDQHQKLVEMIEGLGVPCDVFDSMAHTPDAVYPNNVFGFTSDRFIIGHMLHPVRQAEALHPEITRCFSESRHHLDLSRQAGICELTGSLIIDHARKIGFVGTSQRCDVIGAKAMQEAFHLNAVYHVPLHPREYHTNIALSVLAGKGIVIAPSGFHDPADAQAIAECYGSHALVISEDEKNAFVGNCLAITEDALMMSAHAYRHLKNKDFFGKIGMEIVPVDVSELEKGGGSLRCLIAEIF